MKVLVVCPELPRPGRPNTLAPLVRQIDSLCEIGLDVKVLEVRGLKRLKYLQTLPRFWRLVRDCDVVHAHYAFCGWLAKAQWSRPVVVSFMGTDLMGVTRPDGSMVRRSQVVTRVASRFAKLYEAVIVKSEDMAQRLNGVRPFVVPNGVDFVRFKPIDRSAARARLGWDDQRLRVLFPGSPTNVRKAFPLAQEAISRASAQIAQPIETIVLKGVDPDLVPYVMNACDAMVLCSHHEGSPNVVKEAMACNLPVASVDVGDVRWLCDGVQGYEISSRDAGDLGTSLARLIQSDLPPLGRRRLTEIELDLKSVAEKVRGIYEHAMRQWRGNSSFTPSPPKTPEANRVGRSRPKMPLTRRDGGELVSVTRPKCARRRDPVNLKCDWITVLALRI